MDIYINWMNINFIPFSYSFSFTAQDIAFFEKKTGIGGILSTSFNIHGFPLVGSLDQAMFTFKESHLKYMVLNNFLISKK